MNVCETIKQLNSEKTDAFMHELYGKGAAENKARYEKVLKGFEENFGDNEGILLFSSPGRTEISGNHTDHNHGKVLAGRLCRRSCKELFQPCADHQRFLYSGVYY